MLRTCRHSGTLQLGSDFEMHGRETASCRLSQKEGFIGLWEKLARSEGWCPSVDTLWLPSTQDTSTAPHLHLKLSLFLLEPFMVRE